MHLLGINQWLFIGYFVGRWINFICMSEKAWIFLPLHMGSGGDANVRKSFLASWVRRASRDRLGVSVSRNNMMRRLSKMSRITCAQLWEWYTTDAYCVESIIRAYHRAKARRVDVHEELGVLSFLVVYKSVMFTNTLRKYFIGVSCSFLSKRGQHFLSRRIVTADARLLISVDALWSYYV